MGRQLASVLALLLVLTACSPEEAELTTTTTTASSPVTTGDGDTASTTTAPATTTTGSGVDGTTDDTEVAGPPEHEIVVRSATGTGEILWILVDPADYSGVDLENLIRVLVDETEVTLSGINVFDDLDALQAGRVDEEARTEDEQTLVDEHFLVSLVDGSIIRYHGPYADLGEVAVGS